MYKLEHSTEHFFLRDVVRSLALTSLIALVTGVIAWGLTELNRTIESGSTQEIVLAFFLYAAMLLAFLSIGKLVGAGYAALLLAFGLLVRGALPEAVGGAAIRPSSRWRAKARESSSSVGPGDPRSMFASLLMLFFGPKFFGQQSLLGALCAALIALGSVLDPQDFSNPVLLLVGPPLLLVPHFFLLRNIFTVELAPSSLEVLPSNRENEE